MTPVPAVSDTDLLRGAAHLLRSPLGVVLNIAATLRDYDDRFTPELRATYLGEIWQAAEEMRVALDGLSLLARLIAGNLPFAPTTVPLGGLLSDAREALISVWGNTGAPAVAHAAGAAWADVRRFAQAFEALARCCTPGQGVVLSAEGGVSPRIRIGPVLPRASLDDLHTILAAPVRSPEIGGRISHSGGWAVLLARHLLEGQGGRLALEVDGQHVYFVAVLASGGC